MYSKKTKGLIYLLCIISFFSSCKKDENETPTPTSKDDTNTESTNSGSSYYPLKKGNSWTYFGASNGEYTVTITGDKIIDNETWLIAETAYKNSSQKTTSYMKNKNGNIVTKVTQPNIGDFELILFNGNAKVGESYEAGSISVKQPGSTSNSIYTGKIKNKLDVYTVGNTEYKDVTEVEFTTSTSASLDEAYYKDLGADQETIDFLKESFNGTSIKIIQTQYFANGIGLIFQESNDQPALNVSLVNYTIL